MTSRASVDSSSPGVVVLGMHRAGTSAVTRTLSLLGLHVGEPDALIAPGPANPTGFWEISRLKKINNELLDLLGADTSSAPHPPSRWESSEGLDSLRERAVSVFREVHPRTPWVWKDPRNCITLGFWMEALEMRPIVVLAQRNPLEIVRSLEARDGKSKALSLALWERYMRGALTLAGGLPTFVVRYPDLVAQPGQEYRRLGAFVAGCGIELPAPAEESEVEDFIDERLQHAAIDPAQLSRDPAVSASQRELFSILDGLAGAHEALVPPALPAETAWTEYVLAERREVRQPLREAGAALACAVDDRRAAEQRAETARKRQRAAVTRARALKVERARLEHQLASARGRVADIQGSLSWRLTRPLRALPSPPRKPSERNGRGEAGTRTVQFFRDYRRFSGGHLKVWHYFNHVRASPGHRARIAFTSDSVWTPDNPWVGESSTVTSLTDVAEPGVVFLEGLDWQLLDGRWDPARTPAPVINLIQNVKHALPDNVRRGFLHYPAIRICVSQDVADAIAGTGEVNGPVLTIPAGIDLDSLPEPLPPAGRPVDVMVAGLKRPELGRRLAERLDRPGRTVELLVDQVPRAEFLATMRRSAVVVFLGRELEGLPVPTLEAMALECVLVCPPSPGLGHACRSGENCLIADGEDGLVDAVEQVLGTSGEERAALASRGRQTAQAHGLGPERAAFIEVLDRVDDLWASAHAS